MSTVPSQLLSQVPDELHALVTNYWLDWCSACDEKNFTEFTDLPLALMGKSWACSDFVARTCIRYPDVFMGLARESFEAGRDAEQYCVLVSGVLEQVTDDADLMRGLRQLRQREMLRIAWRDLNEIAEVAGILQELTDLAVAFVSVTLNYLEKQHAEKFGLPLDEEGNEQHLLVFAMGKMGGGELNFSSDIDLIFSYADDGETTGRRQTSHAEFYLAVIRKLVKVLDEVTVDGFVYRVDTRLRPFGESGPMAMSFNGMEQYYQLQGRDWERYAMIKARLITGSEQHKQYLQSMLTPFVYRRYLDFGMLESIREMKAMIRAQMKRKGMANNIKLGTGGIREIEFIGQTLQLIRAGREPELRERSLVKVLGLLAEKDYLKASEVEQLIQAYWFLRRLENRLQMQSDKQTHSLPTDTSLQQRLCLAMGVQNWNELSEQLAGHQAQVDQVFQGLVSTENETTVSKFGLYWDDLDNSTQLRQHLIDAGYQDVEQAIALLSELRNSAQLKTLTGENRRRMERLIVSLLEQIAAYPQPLILIERVSRIIRALAGRSVYISLLTEYPLAQQNMLKLCAASEWFTTRIIKHPILLDGLLISVEAIQREFDVKHSLALELQRIDSHDLEQQMDRLRQFKRQTVFNVAVLDVFYDEPVESVSDELTDLADALIEEVLALSWRATVERYGKPNCIIDGEDFSPSMSVIAYGKMGGNELGYGSDLDIIFLHNSRGEKEYTDGEKSIDNSNFFARVAQRVIHFLDSRTYSGVLYEVDTRLRPNGQSGLMVSSIDAFERYQFEKAWTWEHQALIRARFVSDNLHGNALIEPEFDRIRSSVLRQPREKASLLLEIVEMREKMRQHLTNNSADFDIKQDTGGLVDIEFMTQAGVLLHAVDSADCIKHTATLELILELEKVGWFSSPEADHISQAYRYFRRLKNWQNLQCEADYADVNQHRERVTAVWQRLMPSLQT